MRLGVGWLVKAEIYESGWRNGDRLATPPFVVTVRNQDALYIKGVAGLVGFNRLLSKGRYFSCLEDIDYWQCSPLFGTQLLGLDKARAIWMHTKR